MNIDSFFKNCLILLSLYFVSYLLGKFYRNKKSCSERATNDYINKIIKSINCMDGYQFEDFISFLFKELGYKVKQTPKSRDGGKDLILNTKSGKIYVEVKKYSSNNLISSPLVLKLIGSTVSDGVNRCLFLTTSSYTKDAIALAKNSKVNIELVDLNGLIDMIKKCDCGKILKYLGY